MDCDDFACRKSGDLSLVLSPSEILGCNKDLSFRDPASSISGPFAGDLANGVVSPTVSLLPELRAGVEAEEIGEEAVELAAFP